MLDRRRERGSWLTFTRAIHHQRKDACMRRIAAAAGLAVLCVATTFGQGAQPAGQAGRGRGGPAGPAVVSPEVNADRTVTLRLYAPKATEIAVTGEVLN